MMNFCKYFTQWTSLAWVLDLRYFHKENNDDINRYFAGYSIAFLLPFYKARNVFVRGHRTGVTGGPRSYWNIVFFISSHIIIKSRPKSSFCSFFSSCCNLLFHLLPSCVMFWPVKPSHILHYVYDVWFVSYPVVFVSS